MSFDEPPGIPPSAYEVPAEVRDKFAILAAAGWVWRLALGKGYPHDPATGRYIDYDKLLGMTPQDVADVANGGDVP